MIQLDDLAEGKRVAAPLLDEVRRFDHASRGGDYYEDFNVNTKNFMDKQEGTESFIAEFDRLVSKPPGGIPASSKPARGRSPSIRPPAAGSPGRPATAPPCPSPRPAAGGATRRPRQGRLLEPRVAVRGSTVVPTATGEPASPCTSG